MRASRAIRAGLVAALLPSAVARGQEAGESTPPAPRGSPFPIALSVVLSDVEPFSDRDAREPRLYWVGLAASFERDGWGARADVRGADEKFRPYFAGNVWLQEGYAFRKTAIGDVRVGKVERAFGLEDDTFGGDVLSGLGLKRNPEWGLALDGKTRVRRWDTVDWRASWGGGSDRVSWEADGVDVESDPAARLRDALSVRVRYRRDGGLTWLRPGISLRTERVVARDGSGDFRRSDAALDVTGAVGPISLGLEAALRDGASRGEIERPLRAGYEGGRGGGLHLSAEFPTVTYRWAWTTWRTRETGREDRLHQIAADWTPRKGLRATLEFRFGNGGLARPERIRAVHLGLATTFP